jgi:NADP-dependent aldehyde dehydrogenase
MGSVNPVFFLPEAVKQGGESLARQFAQSVTLGAGQFCTNPGLCIFKQNEDSLSFIQQISNALSSIALHPMLTRGIADAFRAGLQKQNNLPGAKSLRPVTGSVVVPHIIMVFAKDVLQNPDYFEEVFGPSTLAVLADTDEELNQLIGMMPGQLTATIHASEKDFPHVKDLAELLSQKAGRLVLNGFPTGVEVCHAMVHGGPFPATTDSRVTSVGTTSIFRFTRPVCYQNMPADLLPIANS